MRVTWLFVLAFAQGPPKKSWIWTEPGPPPWERTSFAMESGFGSRIATLDDVDCDGVPDLAISASVDQHNGTQSGSVFVVSGADGHLLHRTSGAEPEDRFGESLSSCPDLDGDGAMEVIIRSRNRAGTCISGRTGVVLRDLEPSDAVLVADLDLDGIPDFVFASTADCMSGIHDHRGFVKAVSGRGVPMFSIHGEGELAPRKQNGTCRIDGFGGSLASCGDLDGDGVSDLAAGRPAFDDGIGRIGAIEFLSGRTGTILRTFKNPVSTDRFSTFGHVVGSAGDVDGDGFGDVFTNSDQDGPVFVISGGTGEILRTLTHIHGGGYVEDFGDSVCVAGDLDLDGAPDFAVGCSEFLGDDGDGYGVEIFSGRDGRVLAIFEREASHAVVGRGADFDSDGIPDLPVGLPALDQVVILSGRDFPRFEDRGTEPRRAWRIVLSLSRDQYLP